MPVWVDTLMITPEFEIAEDATGIYSQLLVAGSGSFEVQSLGVVRADWFK